MYNLINDKYLESPIIRDTVVGLQLIITVTIVWCICHGMYDGYMRKARIYRPPQRNAVHAHHRAV